MSGDEPRESCDVLIVGGGPAGSSCARLLRRAGLDVLILDKSEFPRDKVCAGWITPQVVEELRDRPRDYEQGRVLQPITSFVTGMGERAAKPVHYDKIVSYGIRRCEFDHYLLQRSRCAPAARRSLGIDGARRRSLDRQRRDQRGARDRRGRSLLSGRALPRRESRQGRARDLRAGDRVRDDRRAGRHCGVEHDRPELYFCDDLKGYGWCFRKGNFLNVGLGREGNHRLVEHVHAFSRWLQSQGKVPADAPARFKGHAYLLYSHAKRPVVGDGVLIIGDAAGLAYAESGEGIRPAIESGLMAAQIVAAARGDYSKQRLSEYETQLSRTLRRAQQWRLARELIAGIVEARARALAHADAVVHAKRRAEPLVPARRHGACALVGQASA